MEKLIHEVWLPHEDEWTAHVAVLIQVGAEAHLQSKYIMWNVVCINVFLAYGRR